MDDSQVPAKPAVAPPDAPGPIGAASEAPLAPSGGEPAGGRDPRVWVLTVIALLVAVGIEMVFMLGATHRPARPAAGGSQSGFKGAPPPERPGLEEPPPGRPGLGAVPGRSSSGEPPGGGRGGPEPARPRTVTMQFGEFVAALMVLENNGIKLTAEQRSRAEAVVAEYVESSKRFGEAASRIFRVLTSEQRAVLVAPGRQPISLLGEPGKDGMVEKLIPMMEAKAAGTGSGAEPGVASESMVDRFGLLEGLIFLESQPATALNAAQARTALESLQVMRLEVSRQFELEGRLAGLFTSGQLETIRTKTGSASRESYTPWLVLRYLQAR